MSFHQRESARDPEKGVKIVATQEPVSVCSTHQDSQPNSGIVVAPSLQFAVSMTGNEKNTNIDFLSLFILC